MTTKSLFRKGQQFRPETSLSRLANVLDDLGNSLKEKPIKRYHLSIFSKVVRLGEGSSFVVDKGIFLDSNEPVAVKRTLFAETGQVDQSAENGQYSFQDQLELLNVEIRALSHPPLVAHENIVKLLGYGWSVSQGISLPFIVVEYAELGTLDTYLQCSTTATLGEKLDLAHDVACGLNAIHACKIIHGDVKMANVLLFGHSQTTRVVAKLSDFGHAVLWSATRLYEPLYGGTRLYNAPEVFAQDIESIDAETMYKCDIYSYGLLLWGVLKNGLSYFDDSWLEDAHEDRIEFLQCAGINWLYDQAVKFVDTLDDLPDITCDTLKGLLRSCLQYETLSRPNMREIVDGLQMLIGYRPTLNIEELSLQARMLQEENYTDFGPFDLVRTYPSWPPETRKELYVCYGSKDPRSAPGLGLMRRAECHAIGFGAVEDLNQAFRWVSVSAEEGYFPARLYIDRLKEMVPTFADHETKDQSSVSEEVSNQIRLCRSLNAQLATFETDTYYSNRVQITTQMLARYAFSYIQSGSNHESTKSASIKRDLDWDIGSVFGNSVGYLSQLPGMNLGLPNQQLASRYKEDQSVEHNVFESLALSLYSANDADIETALNLFPHDAINDMGSYDLNPLLLACRQGNATAVNMLLEKGADAGRQNHRGHGCLHYLVFFNSGVMSSVAGRLFAAGADPNAQSKAPEVFAENYFIAWGTPLHWAVAANNITAVRILLDLGADPLLSTLEGIDSVHDHFIPLHLAAGLWLPEITELLLFKTKVDSFPGYWPLHMMTRAPPLQKWMIHGRQWQDVADKTIRVLLKHGHKVDQLDHTGMTPLCCAVWLLASELCAGPVVRELLAQGSDPNATIGQRHIPLYHFSIEGLDSNEDNLGLVSILWEHGADFDKPDESGDTALAQACRCKETAVVKFLLSKGVYVHARNQYGYTALHHVAHTTGSELIIESLVAAGLPIDAPDGNGTTALGLAISSSHLETADMLIRHGASLHVNQASDANHTIFHHALRFSRNPTKAVFHLLSSELLIHRPDFKSVINAQYANGLTALHQAVLTMNYACVRELVLSGADPHLVTFSFGPQGVSATRLAEQCLFQDGFLPHDDCTHRGNQRYRKVALKQLVFLRKYDS